MQFHLFNVIAAAAAMVAAAPTAIVGFFDWSGDRGADIPRHATVVIASGAFDHAQPGEFLASGRPVAAPSKPVLFERPLEIMAYQVTMDEYGRCVSYGACKPADAAPASPDRIPATGVSYDDAVSYANWYSGQTGESWRLPTAAEWAFAAGERFAGDLFIAAQDPSNPAVAWIARYRKEAERKRERDPHPKPTGFYGPNAHGVFDMAGNVWEWTSTCYVRATLSPDRQEVTNLTENCGVHVMEGRHRAYMSNFIRDGKSGGCAVGTPPENLGFRLVREAPPLISLAGLRSRLPIGTGVAK